MSLRRIFTYYTVAFLGVTVLIGLAEKFGFFSGLMRALAFVTPRRLLTPVIGSIASSVILLGVK